MTDDPNEAPEEVDAVLEARLQHALAPYEDLLPPEDLEAFREMLIDFLTEHPGAKGLLDEIRERQTSEEKSGERVRRDVAVLEQAGKKYANGRSRG